MWPRITVAFNWAERPERSTTALFSAPPACLLARQNRLATPIFATGEGLRAGERTPGGGAGNKRVPGNFASAGRFAFGSVRGRIFGLAPLVWHHCERSCSCEVLARCRCSNLPLVDWTALDSCHNQFTYQLASYVYRSNPLISMKSCCTLCTHGHFDWGRHLSVGLQMTSVRVIASRKIQFSRVKVRWHHCFTSHIKL